MQPLWHYFSLLAYPHKMTTTMIEEGITTESITGRLFATGTIIENLRQGERIAVTIIAMITVTTIMMITDSTQFEI